MLVLFMSLFVLLALLIMSVYVWYLEQQNSFLQEENCMLKRMLKDQTELHRLGLDAYTAMLQTAKKHSSLSKKTGC